MSRLGHLVVNGSSLRFRRVELRVMRSVMPWPQRAPGSWRGVSSFGTGGPNCHVLLASAPNGVGQ